MLFHGVVELQALLSPDSNPSEKIVDSTLRYRARLTEPEAPSTYTTDPVAVERNESSRFPPAGTRRTQLLEPFEEIAGAIDHPKVKCDVVRMVADKLGHRV